MSKEDRPEGFLGRWSRLKTDARSAQPEARPPAATASVAPDAVAPAAAPADDAPPQLPPVESLTIDSDFRGFFHPKVDESVRRSALRKLFSDPHFNVMDGLDVYIDDYSVSEPLTPAMLAGLKQAQRILRWAEGFDDEAAEADAATEPSPGADAAAIAAPRDDPGPGAASSADADPKPVE
jgi:hypothetical protein